MGVPAVPAGSPASAARSEGGQPSRQAKQTWVASGYRFSSASISDFASGIEVAGATKAKKREPFSRSSLRALPAATR